MKQVKFGRYPQTTDGGIQPIKWLVMKVEGSKALLVSKYALDAIPYNEKITSVPWPNTTLRAWLNGEFLDMAFTSEEQTAICNTFDSSIGALGDKSAADKVFLLDAEEANELFHDDIFIRCAPTAYAKSKGCETSEQQTVMYTTADGYPSTWWWLRSPFSGVHHYAAAVMFDGSVYNHGCCVGHDAVGVRPALWVDLESEFFKNPALRDEPPRSAAFRLGLACPECGNTTWYDVVDSEGAFECAACGTVSLPEEMGTKCTESLPFGRWIRPEGSTRGSYKFQCSVCGQISHQVTGNNGRKVKEDNPKCTYRFCPWCMTPMSN